MLGRRGHAPLDEPRVGGWFAHEAEPLSAYWLGCAAVPDATASLE